jgi:hypothetical protein
VSFDVRKSAIHFKEWVAMGLHTELGFLECFRIHTQLDIVVLYKIIVYAFFALLLLESASSKKSDILKRTSNQNEKKYSNKIEIVIYFSPA